MRYLLGVLVACASLGGWAQSIVLENEAFRLEIGTNACVQSWRLKASGEELLAPGVRVPMATMTQERPYDNEFKLMLPAKPWTHKSNGVVRKGDELHVTFEDEFNIAIIKVDIKPAYMTFTLDRIGYRFEDFGDKRQTEVDALEFLRLPVKPRRHVGHILNCTWEEGGAAGALLAGNVSTRVDAFDREDGNLLFAAEADQRVALTGTQAVLVATPHGAFLDAVDTIEKDLGLPRGVVSRRRADYPASYAFVRDALTPDRVDACIDLVKRLGLRTFLTCIGNVTQTHGTYDYLPEYTRGDADMAEIGNKVRAAGLKFGVHLYASKALSNDVLYVSGKPDPRFATVTELFLDVPIDARATTLRVQGNPALLRREPGRGVLLTEGEIITYSKVVPGRLGEPFVLEGCARGRFNTPAIAHDRLAYMRHLDVDDWPGWIRFDQNSGIQLEAANRLAHIWHVAGFEFIYYDGAEDVPKPFWHYAPRAMKMVWDRLDPVPIYGETALKSHFAWHSASRGNAFDVFQPERLREAMKKYVLRTARQDANDFSSVNFGWLSMRLPERELPPFKPDTDFLHRINVNVGIGMQRDMYDYVASKALAYRAPIALNASLKMLTHPHFEDNAAALKGWEDAKLDNVFTADEKKMLADPEREFFLWPFNAPGARPEIVEWHVLTPMAARPYRAFAFTRAGKSGIVCWNIFEKAPPTLTLPNTTRRTIRGEVFFESDEPVASLQARFLKAIGQ